MQENMRFCHVAYSMKRIEIPLNHIRDKNKFKNSDPLFHLVQCFKTIFVILFIQCFKTTICFIWFNVSRLFLFLTHKKTLCISIYHSNFYSFIYTFPQLLTSCYSVSNTLRQKTIPFTFNLSMTPT